MSTIISPVMLWKDFVADEQLDVEYVSEKVEDGAVVTKLKFNGRKTAEGQVRIFAYFLKPEVSKATHTIAFFPSASINYDLEVAKRFVKKGFAVLAIDYFGYKPDEDDYTLYPNDIKYANYVYAERHIDYVDEDAYKTSWYEWVAVGKYALKYLRSREDVKSIGLLGIKYGGDIIWQLSTTEDNIACAVTIGAVGWRAYKGVFKYDKNAELVMNEERYRYIAAVDSESYAPYVRCPMLMLVSTNDSFSNSDRAYDTFVRINEKVDKIICYTIRSDGFIGSLSSANLDLFLDKYLNNRVVFIPKSINLTIEESEDGQLLAAVTADKDGEIKKMSVYFAQDCYESALRDWNIANFVSSDGDNYYYKLNAYDKSKIVFAFARATFTSGFTVTTRIVVKYIEAPYKNFLPRQKVLYGNGEGISGFLPIYPVVDDAYFINKAASKISLQEGPFGIKGVASANGLRTYRLGNTMYKPDDGAIMTFDAYSAEAGELYVSISCFKAGVRSAFTAVIKLTGGEFWQKIILAAKDFKNLYQKPLEEINLGSILTFASNKECIINNVVCP